MGKCKKTYIEPIIILQKKIVKLITFSKRYSSSKLLFDKLKIMNFETIVNMRIGLAMYKIHIGKVPKCVSEIFQKNFTIHNYNTRTRSQLHNKKGKYELIYETFSFQGIYTWNKISSLIEIDTNIYSFKKNLKILLYKNSLNLRSSK